MTHINLVRQSQTFLKDDLSNCHAILVLLYGDYTPVLYRASQKKQDHQSEGYPNQSLPQFVAEYEDFESQDGTLWVVVLVLELYMIQPLSFTK